MAPEFGKPINQLPLIPADVLKKHRIHEPLDTRFRSAARLLQALWRKERDLPIGSYVSKDGKRRKLGSRISEAAGRGGGNFLTPEIAHIARREVAYREIGALIDEERLATNLLSSMPHDVQSAGALDARTRTRLQLPPGAAAGLHWHRPATRLRTFARAVASRSSRAIIPPLTR